jgi:hypothetical protein
MMNVAMLFPIVTRTLTCGQTLVKILSIKFHKNPFTSSQFVSCMQT